jgi:2-polyprenyl-3-methyl-5-hydroxy-6-metoxy-1,4-benzoquinol methylase
VPFEYANFNNFKSEIRNKLMSKTKIEINCDLCGSSEKKLITIEENYPISACLKCSFIYVNEIPKVENGKVLGEYYEGSEAEIEAGRLRYEAVSKFLIKEINRHTAKGKLLDVGCGYGFFLLEAQKNGWEVFGTELSEIAVSYANTKQNLPNVFYTDLSENVFENQKFEAINLTNVLEHVPSPTKTLLDCKRILSDDGVLTIRVPNMDFNNLKFKLLPILKILRLGKDGELTYLSSPPPIHLSGFSKKTLSKYFKKIGMEIIEVKPSKLSSSVQEKMIYGLFESFVNVIYKLSFSKINLSPTVLAIAKIKQ